MTEKPGRSIADYWPLIVLVLIAAAVGFAANIHYHGSPTIIDLEDGTEANLGCQFFHAMGGLQRWMHTFMGFFLCSFAMLKLFRPASFADGFQMYDLLAKRSRAYAYIYPYIELALGLSYLSFYEPIFISGAWQLNAPVVVYGITILLFGFSAIGVLLALKRGLNTKCACMGTILNVPLSTVTLTEDIAMIAMAAWMLLRP
jgi:hypothetical protein